MPLSDFADEPLDIEQLREILESRGYALIRERVDLAITTNMRALLREQDIGMIRYTQGYIQGLQSAGIDIPTVLIEELKAQAARGNNRV